MHFGRQNSLEENYEATIAENKTGPLNNLTTKGITMRKTPIDNVAYCFKVFF